MASTQYPSYSYPNWSSEISGAPAQPAAHASTTTTTTTTSSASAGPQMGGLAPQMMTTTTTGTASPMQNGAPMQSPTPMQSTAPMQNAASGTGSAAGTSAPMQSSTPPRNEFEGSSGTLDLETHQPIEVIEAPTSMNEAFLGSMKSMLMRNRGSFVTATFLIGTQGTTTWEGILHDVGNDHIIIFQPGRQRYIACDLYALKYIEFYDTRERDACRQLLRQSTRNSQMNYGRNDFY